MDLINFFFCRECFFLLFFFEVSSSFCLLINLLKSFMYRLFRTAFFFFFIGCLYSLMFKGVYYKFKIVILFCNLSNFRQTDSYLNDDLKLGTQIFLFFFYVSLTAPCIHYSHAYYFHCFGFLSLMVAETNNEVVNVF